jgi:hypothetical protein
MGKQTERCGNTKAVKENKTFCPIPWKHAVLATDGAFLSCAIAASTSGGGLVRYEAGGLMRAGKSTLSEFRNSAAMRKLRLNMLAGKETPSVCQRCIDEEKHGLPFRRALEKSKAYFSMEEAQAATAPDGSIDPTKTGVAVFNIRPGNLCNLRCRTCGPAQSSAWYDEWYDNYHRGFRDSGIRYALRKAAGEKARLDGSPYGWFGESSFEKEILANLSSLKEIHFSGGEPLISPDHLTLVRKLAESGRAREIALDYNSNLTRLPSQLFEIWRSFRKVTIGVSVDGVGPLNDYLRPPSRFAEIRENLEKLDAAGSHIQYWITSTVSSLNVGRYHELVGWLMSEPFTRMNRRLDGSGSTFLSHHMLRRPSELCVRALPAKAKALVRSRYEEFLAANPISSAINFAHAKAQLQSVLAFMEAEDTSSELAKNFIRETEKMDAYRGEDFASLDPEFWAAIHD